MKITLWDVVKIVSGIVIVKLLWRVIDSIYVYVTDENTRRLIFKEIEKNDEPQVIQTLQPEKEEDDNTVKLGFQY